MRCQEARERLIELLESSSEPEELEAVEKHAAECPDCRAELEFLREGLEALEESLQELAPEGRYLTRGRLRRLRRAFQLSRRKRRVSILGSLVASAAVAAILVSGLFIYQDVGSLFRAPSPPQPRVARTLGGRGAGLSSVRVGLASSPQEGRLREVWGYVRAEDVTEMPSPGAVESLQGADLVLTSSPGVYVPVDNIFYDAEQAGYWW